MIRCLMQKSTLNSIDMFYVPEFDESENVNLTMLSAFLQKLTLTIAIRATPG